jgi:hypothetical protein
MLWSIDNANFDNQYRYISALAAGAQVPQTDSTTTPPWSFQPTMDALRRNREPTLAAPVINHHMGGLRVSDSVGRGLTNNKADVLAVQDGRGGSELQARLSTGPSLTRARGFTLTHRT